MDLILAYTLVFFGCYATLHSLVVIETRRQFIKDIVKLAAVASVTPALLSTDTARGEAVVPPQYLPHYLSLGFTYGGDECRFLNDVLDPHPRISASTLIDIGKYAEDILKEDCSDCQVDFGRGAAPLDHSPQTNINDLSPLYEAASAKGIKIIQVIGQDQPYYPRKRLPRGLTTKDPDFQKKYLELVYEFKFALDQAGFTRYVSAWQLGNESFNPFGQNDPASTVQAMEALKGVVSDTKKPTVINDFFSFNGPSRPWAETQRVADMAALDFYLQAENSRGTITGLKSSTQEYKAYSRVPVVGLEQQTGPWKTHWWDIQNFTNQDFLDMFYTLSPLIPVIGLWELDKRYCYAKKGKEVANFRAIIQAMHQTSRWNARDSDDKIVNLAVYRAFRRGFPTTLAA